MFFCSCTNTELINLNEGVKFIDVINNNKNYDYERIKLSTSYTENNNKICLYITCLGQREKYCDQKL